MSEADIEVNIKLEDIDYIKGLTNAEKRSELTATNIALAVKGVDIAWEAVIGTLRTAGEFVLAATDASREQALAEAKLQAILESTGQAGEGKIDMLRSMAGELQSTTTATEAQIYSAQALAASFGELSDENFRRVSAAAIDLATAIDGVDFDTKDLQDVGKDLGEMLSDAAQGIATNLDEFGIAFTQLQQEQIRLLAESGDVAGAQAVVLDEVEKRFGSVSENLRAASGGTVEWNNAVNQLQVALGGLVSGNSFIAEGIRIASEGLSGLGGEIEARRADIISFSKSFSVGFVQAVGYGVEVLRFLANGLLGVRQVGAEAFATVSAAAVELYDVIRSGPLLVLDTLAEKLVALGAIDSNPFDSIESALGDLRVSSAATAEDMREQVEQVNRGYDVVARTVDDFRGRLEDIPAEFAEIGSGAAAAAGGTNDFVKSSTAGLDQLSGKVQDLKNAFAQGWDGESLTANAVLEDDYFRAQLQRLIADAADASEGIGEDLDIDALLRTDEFRESIGWLTTTVADIDDSTVNIDALLNDSAFKSAVSDVVRSVDDLDSEEAEPSLTLDVSDFSRELDSAVAEFDDAAAHIEEPVTGQFSVDMESPENLREAIRMLEEVPTLDPFGDTRAKYKEAIDGIYEDTREALSEFREDVTQSEAELYDKIADYREQDAENNREHQEKLRDIEQEFADKRDDINKSLYELRRDRMRSEEDFQIKLSRLQQDMAGADAEKAESYQRRIDDLIRSHTRNMEDFDYKTRETREDLEKLADTKQEKLSEALRKHAGDSEKIREKLAEIGIEFNKLNDENADTLRKMFEDGKISAELFGTTVADIKKGLVDMDGLVNNIRKGFDDSFSKGLNRVFGRSFEGGGETRNGPRSGGVDGSGGYFAVVHPNEIIIDKEDPKKGIAAVARTFAASPDRPPSAAQVQSGPIDSQGADRIVSVLEGIKKLLQDKKAVEQPITVNVKAGGASIGDTAAGLKRLARRAPSV